MRFLRFMSTPMGRTIRVVMGVSLVVAGVLFGGVGGWALAGFGLLPLVTGAAGVCPISPLVGEPFRGGSRCGAPTTSIHR